MTSHFSAVFIGRQINARPLVYLTHRSEQGVDVSRRGPGVEGEAHDGAADQVELAHATETERRVLNSKGV